MLLILIFYYHVAFSEIVKSTISHKYNNDPILAPRPFLKNNKLFYRIKNYSEYKYVISDIERNSNHLTIVGGRRAPDGKYAYMVGLRSYTKKNNICGGSLISSYYVLTAAHCLDEVKMAAFGTHINNDLHNIIRFEKVHIHPLYDHKTYDYDFAIIKLMKPVPYSIAKPIILAENNVTKLFINKLGDVKGWGVTKENGKLSRYLLQIKVKIWDNKNCKKIIHDIRPSMLCAGGIKQQDACGGDSGGPLTVEFVDKNHKERNKNIDVLIGLVSWGKSCGAGGYPGVYSRVSIARSFIDKYARGHRWILS